jgi:hypothetical protein
MAKRAALVSKKSMIAMRLKSRIFISATKRRRTA